MVAPRVGAWIETVVGYDAPCLRTSHPVWVRGLKQEWRHSVGAALRVAPRVGAWIETNPCITMLLVGIESHPVWVRGLKPYPHCLDRRPHRSHPVWVRGLKLEHLEVCF